MTDETGKGAVYMKKWVRMMTVFLLCAVFVIGLLPQKREYRIAAGNRINFSQLLSDLLAAYETSPERYSQNVDFDLKTIRAVNQKDYMVAKAIADHWSRVYLDPGYRMNLYRDGDSAEQLLQEGIPNSGGHAFVVLGYELKNGEMTDELKGRCDAAAAAARTFPNAILVCSGGATGQNNPEQHTEAGLMKNYLVRTCGIDEARIYTDERAMTTAENAINTFEILRERGVQTMTIVTSSYHQRWGQVLYNAMAAIYGQSYGYTPEIISNYSFDLAPENEMFRNDAGIAISQLRGILNLPRQAGNPRY